MDGSWQPIWQTEWQSIRLGPSLRRTCPPDIARATH